MLLTLVTRLFRSSAARKPQAYAEAARQHIARNEFAAAAEMLAAAAALEPGNAGWHAAEADCRARCGDMASAVRCLQKATSLTPEDARLWTKLGYAHWELMLVDEAITAYRRALQCDPRAQLARGNLLFALIHHCESLDEHLEEAKRWARYAVPEDLPPPSPFPNSRDADRRLRIGYVSADFRNHAMAQYSEPLLEWHDRARFDVVCYDGTPAADRTSDRLRSYRVVWRPIGTLDDEHFAAQVRADGIDILVDLSGHTAGNRLSAFTRGLAPIQVCGGGYPATTGMDAFDWRLTDALNDPPGIADRFYTERLYRVRKFSGAYRPASATPVSREPAPGFVFASLNNGRKITARMARLWGRLLLRVPDARLLVAGTPEGPARARIAGWLREAGAPEDRVGFTAWLAREAYTALHGKIDVALDTYPYNGSSTTLEALWHGVPMITLSGSTVVSRQARAYLEAIGEPQFAADAEEQYLEIAEGLAQGRAEGASLRARLHEKTRRSVLLDGRDAVARLEEAYLDMWTRWCNRPDGRVFSAQGSAPARDTGRR